MKVQKNQWPLSCPAWSIARHAIFSRVVVLFAMIFLDWVIEDYDTSAAHVNLAGSCEVIPLALFMRYARQKSDAKGPSLIREPSTWSYLRF
jgi:hypothetical protein